ncbi:hypothetical protein DFJ74DRAFT_32739 [Hyaloraphidium curvatum]|nr:hypothetical protein DFJ74DRAFT_32739 [Hyaloraphidium curvatum]
MEKALTQSTEFTGTVRVFQSIPRTLRRRAASHNIKRLPPRHRPRAIREAQKDQNPPKEVKNPPKRKKKSKLPRAQEFLRRQGQFKWLETHVWHAKRFHMDPLWGFKIPVHTNEKTGRSMYRYARTGCIVHDMSYWPVIELKGSREDVAKVMELLMDPTEAMGLGSKVYTAGARQGSTVLYEAPGGFPSRPIGPVYFLWNSTRNPVPGLPRTIDPESMDDDARRLIRCRERQLWLWIHPATLDRALNSLDVAIGTLRTGGQRPGNFAVTVTNLQQELVRFRLTGPRSTLVLRSLLEIVGKGSDLESEGPDLRVAGTATVAANLWTSLGSLGSRTDALLEGSVLALTVQDPRLTFPQKIKKGEASSGTSETPTQTLQRLRASWPGHVAASDIWSGERRRQLLEGKVLEKSLNERRRRNAVPGTRLRFGEGDAAIPILLIQRRGFQLGPTPDAAVETSEGAFGSGWDIVVPAGWGMAFWKSLAFLDCKPSGLREQQSLHFESNCVPYFPTDFVGNPVQQASASKVADQKRAHWERTPVAKRTNFAKLGVAHPFLPDWAGVTRIANQEDSSCADGGTVHEMFGEDSAPWMLHSQKLLNVVQRVLTQRASGADDSLFEAVVAACSTSLKGAVHTDSSKSTLPADKQLWNTALVAVRLKYCEKGLPSKNAVIYRPSDSEYEELAAALDKGGKRAVAGDAERTPATLDALEELAQLFEAEERLASRVQSVTTPSDDRAIGYITTGGYSLSAGRGQAIGACSLVGLAELFGTGNSRRWRNLVLVRNTTAYLARPAFLEFVRF